MMARHFGKTLLISAVTITIGSYSCKAPGKIVQDGLILYNQVGYVADAPKMLLVADEVSKVIFYDEAGNEVTRVEPAPAKYWELSGDSVRKVDFSAITTPGNYKVVLPGFDATASIVIANRPYKDLSHAALKAFYLNRSAIPIEPEYAGRWARPAGHPDTVVFVHTSAATANRPEGTVISSPLGWYDAGDYNKYVVNSGISTYTLFRALEDFTAYFDTLDVNIPETGAAVPDILSETLFNLKWVLTMQDPYDGGVYHKLTNKHFDGYLMPHEAIERRYVVAKSTAATLNYAALAAKAHRVLLEHEESFPGLAAKCLERAKLAWQWALKNPAMEYIQPEDIHTGIYGDNNFDDEWFWAAAELYLATSNPEFKKVVLEKYSFPVVPNWSQVAALGFMSLLDNYDKLPAEIRERGIKNDFLTLVDSLSETSRTAPYGVSISHFAWGSNSEVANHGMLKLFAYNLTGNINHLHSAISDLDYLLGRNATGFCFVTGFGNKRVMNIHHRPSMADENPDPVPGFLAGGPNLATFDDCGPEVIRSPYPAKSYVDLSCSYSTNEIAINWNAPLVYLVGGLEAILSD